MHSVAVYALSPEHAVELAKQGLGVIVPTPSDHMGQATSSQGWNTSTLLLWGALGFAAGGIVGGILGWHLCASMEIGKVVAGQLPHLLPALLAA